MEVRMNRLDNNKYSDYSVVSGLWAGIIAAAGMAILLIAQSTYAGLGFWFPLQLNSAVIYGSNAILGGFAATIIGLIMHVAIAAVLGIMFSVLLPNRISSSNAIRAGIVYGFLIWIVSTYIGMPILNPVMSERMALTPALWFFSCILFGALLGTVPSIRRAYRNRDGILENFEVEQRAAA
jgi:hypothetical protein